MIRINRLALGIGVAALGITGIATEASAQWLPRGWRVIGVKVVNGQRDHDTIRVPGRQAFRQLRLCAFNAPVHIRDVDVVFGNGRRQDLAVRQYIAPNSCTRNIDLRGQFRDVRSVRLKYDRIYRGRAPLVRVAAR
jgi:hypothetical protein